MRNILWLLLLTCSICFGQRKTRIFHDTSVFLKFGFPYKQSKSIDIKAKGDTIVYRYKTCDQIIDIWTNDAFFIGGTIGNITNSVNRRDPQSERFFCQKILLDSNTSKEVYQIFKLLLNDSFDDEYEQYKSQSITDGYSCSIKSYSLGYSKHKYFLSHDFYGKYDGLKAIDSVIMQLNRLLNLKEVHSAFLQSLPRRKYRSGNFMIYQKPRFGSNIKRLFKP